MIWNTLSQMLCEDLREDEEYDEILCYDTEGNFIGIVYEMDKIGGKTSLILDVESEENE